MSLDREINYASLAWRQHNRCKCGKPATHNGHNCAQCYIQQRDNPPEVHLKIDAAQLVDDALDQITNAQRIIIQ